MHRARVFPLDSQSGGSQFVYVCTRIRMSLLTIEQFSVKGETKFELSV